MFKPRGDMTLYATFADSIQAPDVAAANSGSIVIVNANQALAPYRSKQGELGYMLRLRRINFSTAFFRIDRPFGNYAAGVANPLCGQQSGNIELRGVSDQRRPDQLRYRDHALGKDHR
jgi:iron complex outermembrane receptor protein